MTEDSTDKAVIEQDKEPEADLAKRMPEHLAKVMKGGPLKAQVYRELSRDFSPINQTTLCDAMRRLDKVCISKDKADERVQQKDALMIAVIEKRDTLVKAHSGAFDQMREMIGINHLKEELLDEIAEYASIEKGLKKINKSLKKKYKSTEELSRDYHNVTNMEVALISLLKGDFSGIITNTRIIDYKEYNEVKTKEIKTMMRHHETYHDGIEFVNFDFNESVDELFGEYQDVYKKLGFTGESETALFFSYEAPISRKFKKLTLLYLQDEMVYEKLIEEISNIERGCDLVSKTGKGLSEFYSDNLILDVNSGKVMDLINMLRVISLLNHMPFCLNGENPFAGMMIPYGVSLKFIDKEGSVVETVPYHPYVIVKMKEQMHETTEDISRRNRIVAAVSKSIEDKIYEKSMQTEDLSKIDSIKLRLQEEYDIHLETRTIKSLKFADKDSLSKHLFRIEYTSKISHKEGEFIEEMIRSFPKELVGGIESISKHYVDSADSGQMLLGIAEAGLYSPFSRKLKLFQMLDNIVFEDFNKLTFQIYKDTIAHEFGHHVWYHVLNEEERKEYARLIDWDVIEDEENKGIVYLNENHSTLTDHHGEKVFLSLYSAKLTEDDFAETFMAYRCHGEEFRKAAETSTIIKKKYQFMQRVFTLKSEEGITRIEYNDSAHASLAEIDKTYDKRSQMTYEEILESIEATEEKIFELNREKMAEKIKSYEEIGEEYRRKDDIIIYLEEHGENLGAEERQLIEQGIIKVPKLF